MAALLSAFIGSGALPEWAFAEQPDAAGRDDRSERDVSDR